MDLRDLPSVNEVVERLSPSVRRLPHGLLVAEARHAIDAARDAIRSGIAAAKPIEAAVQDALAGWTQPSLRRVINATGVVLHTNLGRAPLAPFELHRPGTAISNMTSMPATAANATSTSERLLEAILGRPAIAVNNGAAALFLVLNELAAGGEAIVSRGELIEIGDGFRIPEIMRALRRGAARSRHHESHPNRRLPRRHQRSNARAAARPSEQLPHDRIHRAAELTELVQLGRERGIPVYEDLGSGCMVDLRAYGVDEPLAQDSLAAGANLVSFSGDKMLGGPQAGIIAGDPDLVARVRRNPLFRALRQDKLFIRPMETTLRHILLGE